MSESDPEPKKEPEPKKTVWVSCRATPGCEGKEAYVVWKRQLPVNFNTGMGGKSIRYRCLTCNATFHISF